VCGALFSLLLLRSESAGVGRQRASLKAKWDLQGKPWPIHKWWTVSTADDGASIERETKDAIACNLLKEKDVVDSTSSADDQTTDVIKEPAQKARRRGSSSKCSRAKAKKAELDASEAQYKAIQRESAEIIAAQNYLRHLVYSSECFSSMRVPSDWRKSDRSLLSDGLMAVLKSVVVTMLDPKDFASTMDKVDAFIEKMNNNFEELKSAMT
jgi:hypothetical protein